VLVLHTARGEGIGQDWTGLDRIGQDGQDGPFVSFLERYHSIRWPSKFTSTISDRKEERMQRVLR